MRQLLFSYGTLQLESVQIQSFGRLLKGELDVLKGFKIEQLQIKDKSVLAKSQQEFHPIAVQTNNYGDTVEGMIFEISDLELAQADQYEVADYKRIECVFQSGKKAWVYVKS